MKGNTISDMRSRKFLTISIVIGLAFLPISFLLWLPPTESHASFKHFDKKFVDSIGMRYHHTNLTHRVAMNSQPFSAIPQRHKLPVEPEEFDDREIKAYYDWRTDMFFREFDLTGSGSVNFMTARRTYKVWLDEYGTPVVLTMGDPVFYWIDLNGNGKFEQGLGEMFKDSYEDGVTGNEEPYDNSDLQEPAGPGPLWNPPQQ